MPRPPQIPEGQAFRDAWTKLDRDGRRRVRRAVNRGQEAVNRNEARLAVAMARNQLRFWRWGWLVGPAVVLVITLPQGLDIALVNLAVVLAAVALMAWIFRTRAQRTERLNLALLERKRRR